MSVIRDEVVARLGKHSPPIYLVWEPILGTDNRAAAERSARKFAGPRIHQYWDEGRKLGDTLGAILKLPPGTSDNQYGFAWDVYLLYPKGIDWTGAPPLPSLWMHQLYGVPNELAPRLDGKRLREAIIECSGN